ncbi:MAG: PVC-type heme-binding CxxCH protein [Verrucomicrobiota bacterium]
MQKIRLPEGFKATLFAAEPDVQQPVALATDDRGRLWVVECFTYAERQKNFDRELNDRILIFEDTDGDGRHDTRTVFWDAGKQITSVEIGFGGIWVLAAPNLLFIPDRNRDDVPDSPPEVMLTGWNNDRARHNIVNGLRWGPDGWLYGRHGITATSYVGPPDSIPADRTRMHCGIWRFHPKKHIFEPVAHGTTNPWGHDWDDYGQLFFINTVIGHLWHTLPGAHFQRMFGDDFTPHLYELLPQTADHYHWDTNENWSDVRKLGITSTSDAAGGGHAHCGMMIYLGDNWPAQYRNGLFTLNLHGRRINHDHLVREGAGYVGKHAPDFMFFGDEWFRGVELLYGPDGGVYVADWSDTGECHDNDGVHRTSGRIYKITHGSPSSPHPLGLRSLDSKELVAMQTAENDWFVRQARLALHERAHENEDMSVTHTELRHLFENHTDVRKKLRALWTLFVTGGASDDWLASLLEHPEEHVRVWAVRLLTDETTPHHDVRAKFAQLAQSDPSGLVLLHLASALQKLNPADRWSIAEALAQRKEFVGDPTYPLMLWYGIEGAIAADPKRALALATNTSFPRLPRFIARRLTTDIDSKPESVAELASLLHSNKNIDTLAILTGMNEALRGRSNAASPAGWKETASLLKSSENPEIIQRTNELSLVFGDGRAADEIRDLIRDKNIDFEARRNAIDALAKSRDPQTLKLLRVMVTDRDLADAAIRGLERYDDPSIADLLVDQYDSMRDPAQIQAVNTLASRSESAAILLKAVNAGQIPATRVSAAQIRQLRNLGNHSINELLNAIWPNHPVLTGDKSGLFEKYRELVTKEALDSADPQQGRIIFQSLCSSCHKLYDNGGAIGPELTGSDRRNLSYLLENIIDPSATLAENYRLTVATLKDGRVLSGSIAGEDDGEIRLQTIAEQVTVRRDDIKSLETSEVSLMPEGLLSALSPEQALNLFSYLMSERAP